MQLTPGCVQEVLPALLTVMTQPQRVAARHLLTPQDRAGRQHLAGVLLSHAVTFDQVSLWTGLCRSAA